jgi:hypothetical protein
VNRVILLGMNQPAEGAEPLDPRVLNGAGSRLLFMLNIFRTVSEASFRAAFDRRNVLDTREWDDAAARDRSRAVLESLPGRRVVVLGKKVRGVLGLPQGPACEWKTCFLYSDASAIITPARMFTEEIVRTHTFKWTHIPHPSGLCREYNEPAVRQRVGAFLAGLYDEYADACRVRV